MEKSPPTFRSAASGLLVQQHTGDGESFRKARQFDPSGGAAAWWQLDDRLVVSAARRIQMSWKRGRIGHRGGIFFVSGILLDGTVARIERYKRGFTELFKYMIATATFFTILMLQQDPAQAFCVERALVDTIQGVQLPDDGTLESVHTIDDIYDFWAGLVDSLYDGNEIYSHGHGIQGDSHTCNMCAMDPAVSSTQIECGSWEASGRRVAGRCWDEEGQQRTGLNASETLFCTTVCFPPHQSACKWADAKAASNTGWFDAGVANATTGCAAHFCFSSCAKAGVVPEMPLYAQPQLNSSEKARALVRMGKFLELTDWMRRAGTRKDPMMGVPSFDRVLAEDPSCQRSNGRSNRRFIRFYTGGRIDMLANGHDGQEATGWVAGGSAGTSRIIGMMNVVQKRRKRLDHCPQTTQNDAQLEAWYGDCYSNSEHDTEWADAGRYMDMATKASWYPLNGTGQWMYFPQADGFFQGVDLGAFDFGKQASICSSRNFQAAGWIDQATSEVSFKMTSYNGNYGGIYAIVNVHFDISLGGYVQPSYKVSTIVRKGRYRMRSAADYARVVLEAMFLVFLSSLSMELLLVRGRSRRSNGNNSLRVRLWRFWHDSENVLDLASVLVWWTNVVVWIFIEIDGQKFRPPLDTHVGDMHGYLTIVAMQREMERAAWVHSSVYGILNSVSVFLSIIKIFVKLQFSKRMSIITDTITEAAVELVHFFLLFGLVVLFYAFMGFLVFGSRLDDFRWYYKAIFYVLDMALFGGDVSELEEVDAFVGNLFYWSFVALVAVLMINILLAIAVASFDKQKESTGCSDTFWESFTLWLSLSQRFPPSPFADGRKAKDEGKGKGRDSIGMSGNGSSSSSSNNNNNDIIDVRSDRASDSVPLQVASQVLRGLGLRGSWYKRTMRTLVELSTEIEHGHSPFDEQDDAESVWQREAEDRRQVTLAKVLSACHELRQRYGRSTSASTGAGTEQVHSLAHTEAAAPTAAARATEARSKARAVAGARGVGAGTGAAAGGAAESSGSGNGCKATRSRSPFLIGAC